MTKRSQQTRMVVRGSAKTKPHTRKSIGVRTPLPSPPPSGEGVASPEQTQRTLQSCGVVGFVPQSRPSVSANAASSAVHSEAGEPPAIQHAFPESPRRSVSKPHKRTDTRFKIMGAADHPAVARLIESGETKPTPSATTRGSFGTKPSRHRRRRSPWISQPRPRAAGSTHTNDGDADSRARLSRAGCRLLRRRQQRGCPRAAPRGEPRAIPKTDRS
jgi:hypothetical protein